MLLLFILSFVFSPWKFKPNPAIILLQNCLLQDSPTGRLASAGISQSLARHWGNCALGTGIQLEESFLKGVVMKPTLSGIAWTFWQTVWVTETLFMCLWAPLPAELPFPWQWFPFQVTSAHKVWCNIIENVHAFIRGYSIKYAGTFKYISDCDSKQWLNTCQRFMMKSEVSSFKRQHPFFIGILYCLIYSVYL